ncbi:GerA spore germination protein [Paenibacillus sp. UNCCL117]|uniref:spore germination protein n=1 Tax=unclassified Paenibacillus TaxID=185978 RepID=UPI0008851A6D|nr:MULTISPECIES: spore germination protein [unclassified Paenibacillus]SDD97213.1 GerA spore germination protein [Paenibacillus sp. cl123]SFW56236.1 GerA spore germination protein [Paenibacillus sp. UNCCL117]
MNDRAEAVLAILSHCEDVISTQKSYDPEGRDTITIIQCRTLCDARVLTEDVLPDLQRIYLFTRFSSGEAIERAATIPLKEIESLNDAELAGQVLAGNVVLWFPRLGLGYSYHGGKRLARDTEESNIEVSIRGPKDGLVENLMTNLGLIRQRLPSPTVAFTSYTVGTKSKTRVGLMYCTDKLSPDTLSLITSKLSALEQQIEELSSATQLEELISDQPYSLFPLSVYTGRTDFITSSLLRGRFVILIDGVPGAIVAPATMTLLLKTAEDAHFNFISATSGRLLRLVSLYVSIFLPSFYIALTGFHQDQLPFPLLSTISMTRVGVPFSVPVEMLLILLLMEVFREAGYRLPSSIGQTITVVGGLIIGDAAIRAGLTSPTIVVVAAVSVVAGSTLINQTLTGTVSVIRYFNLLLASVLGMYGFMLSCILVIVYIAGLTSYGIPYLSPLSPVNPKDVLRAVILLPRKWRGRKPEHLKRK